MAEKRYWWLKLPEDFFGSKRVKRLRKEDDGDTLLIIYLKLQLLAIRDDGIIRFAALEASFEDELALDTEESPENIRRCLDYLIRNGLAAQPDESTLFFPWRWRIPAQRALRRRGCVLSDSGSKRHKRLRTMLRPAVTL